MVEVVSPLPRGLLPHLFLTALKQSPSPSRLLPIIEISRAV